MRDVWFRYAPYSIHLGECGGVVVWRGLLKLPRCVKCLQFVDPSRVGGVQQISRRLGPLWTPFVEAS